MTSADDIRRTLNVLFEPDQVIELRLIWPNGYIDAGYFNDREKLVKAALKYNGQAAQYVTANVINPSLIARYNNRIERKPKSTTADKDVLVRRWLPFEFDPARPAGIPSSDGEHALAHTRALDCRAWLTSNGWPEPIYADSGNGAWLLYRLPDLPNTPEMLELLKRCADAISAYFDGGGIAVDKTVYNAARIVRLFGTENIKGDGDEAQGRRHRPSRIIEGL